MTVFPESGPVTLRTNLADYPTARALKSGAVRSDLVTFDFCGPKVANQGFKPMVREDKFDAGELAIATFLQAKLYGKPLVLLPAVVMGRPQHQCILYHASRGELTPKDLEGRRVGIRAYSQTTAVWVRSILQHEYGVDLERITWVCSDDGHLAEYRDPPNVERLPPGGKSIERMLIDGELDAAILGSDLPDEPSVRHVIPQPRDASRAWCEKHGAVPINHMFVVSKPLADARPDVVREIFRLLVESKRAAPLPKSLTGNDGGATDPPPAQRRGGSANAEGVSRGGGLPGLREASPHPQPLPAAALRYAGGGEPAAAPVHLRLDCDDGIDFHPFGVEANRRPLELMIQYSVEQKIIPRPFAVDDLFDDVTRTLVRS